MAHFINPALCNIGADSANMYLLWFLTLLKQDSHSVASSVCRSWTRSALWRYVRACIRTCRLASQHSQAMPEVANDNHEHLVSNINPRFLHSNYGSAWFKSGTSTYPLLGEKKLNRNYNKKFVVIYKLQV